MTSFYAIYKDDPIFGKLKKDSCPSRSDMCGNLGVLSGGSYEHVSCAKIVFTDKLDDSPNGCCVVDSSDQSCLDYMDYDDDTANFHDIGIKYLDANGKNGRTICHSAPIRKKTIQIEEFFIIIVINAIVLIITAIIGACYEFWFRYGDSTNCIFYKMDCDDQEKLSIIDYMFPTKLCQYPYQECKRKSAGKAQSGGKQSDRKQSDRKQSGGEFIHGYKDAPPNEHGVKCVTIHNDVENLQTKPMPYNLVDWANINIKSELLRLPFKAFAFYFLHSARISRAFIKIPMKFLSIKYQKIVKNNVILSNIMYLLFTGILFNVIAKYTNTNELNGANGYILYALIMLITCGSMYGFVATTIGYFWFPNQILSKTLEPCKIDPSYYGLIDFTKLFWSITDTDKELISVGTKVLHIFLNLLIIFPLFIMMMLSLCIGQMGSILAMIYMIFSLLFNIFYIPMSNTIEFLDIIKSHGNLLTILFCISIVLASADKLNPKTTGIIGSILGILILYKIITNLN